MKKTLLAAALAVGFAGVAQAETSVTLYGIIDTGLAYERIKLGDERMTKTGLYDGANLGQAGSRWGLRGVEDLGNGLRAVFQLESGFDVTTGHSQQGGRLFGRQATVGLHSDSWGQIDIGRQTNMASKYFIGMVDPFGGGFGAANAGQTFTSANTVRYDNSIIYQTPNFSGFQFGLGYSFNVGGPQKYKLKGFKDDNSRAITAALRYANGPIGVALTYDQMTNAWDKDVFDTKTIHAWNIGGSYDFEVVKVSLAFGQTRNGFIAAGDDAGVGIPGVMTPITGYNQNTFNRKARVNNYLVGLSAPVGAGTVMASWTMADPNKKIASNSDNRKKFQTYALGYKYPLSKRTDVYAYYAHNKNLGFVRKTKRDVLAAGLTHRF